jgi:hypothetical protein
MNLWERLEIRGRKEFELDDLWHLYAINLSETQDLAELKFAKKEGQKYLTGTDFVGYVKYKDLRN